jgi:hypothetical protein
MRSSSGFDTITHLNGDAINFLRLTHVMLSCSTAHHWLRLFEKTLQRTIEGMLWQKGVMSKR